jgi:hypothetical protein
MDRMKTKHTLAALLSLACAAALAQSESAPSAEVRKFIEVGEPLLALTHVRVVDGTGAAAHADRTVIVRGGRIEAILDAAAAPPAGARVLDLTGRTVIPGLVGMHNHLMYTASLNLDEDDKLPPPGFLVTELAFSAPRLYLAAGVTTMRTTGSVEPYTDLNIRRLIDAGKMPGPHLDVTGPYLEGKGSVFPQMTALDAREQARRTVAFWSEEGATSFKAYMNIPADVLGAAITEAHKHGAKLTGHLCSVDYRQAIALGIDDLEHGPVFTDAEFVPNRTKDTCPPSSEISKSWLARDIASPEVQALIQDLVKHKVAITSTLPVFESFVATRPVLSKKQQAVMSAESLRSHLAARASAATSPERAAMLEAALKKEMAFEVAFVRAGGLLLAGPDPTGNGGVLPGFGDQRAIELLVEAGFTPLEAIHIGTANGARYLGRLAKIGTVEAGKNADLVVVKGDPSTRIQDIENVEIVFKDGVGYDPARLNASVRGMVGIR